LLTAGVTQGRLYKAWLSVLLGHSTTTSPRAIRSRFLRSSSSSVLETEIRVHGCWVAIRFRAGSEVLKLGKTGRFRGPNKLASIRLIVYPKCLQEVPVLAPTTSMRNGWRPCTSGDYM